MLFAKVSSHLRLLIEFSPKIALMSHLFYEKHASTSQLLKNLQESLEENISICKKYLERMAKINLLLEMELGVTGGEEDGVDNSDVDSSRLYTQPEECRAR